MSSGFASVVNGVYCNKNDITNGPAAGYGLYLGTLYSNDFGTYDHLPGGYGTGGTPTLISVWNKYKDKILVLLF